MNVLMSVIRDVFGNNLAYGVDWLSFNLIFIFHIQEGISHVFNRLMIDIDPKHVVSHRIILKDRGYLTTGFMRILDLAPWPALSLNTCYI